MSRSLRNLRRTMFGVSCAVVFGFGASQAPASTPQSTARNMCRPELEEYCDQWCPPPGGECALTPTGFVCNCY